MQPDDHCCLGRREDNLFWRDWAREIQETAEQERGKGPMTENKSNRSYIPYSLSLSSS